MYICMCTEHKPAFRVPFPVAQNTMHSLPSPFSPHPQTKVSARIHYAGVVALDKTKRVEGRRLPPPWKPCWHAEGLRGQPVSYVIKRDGRSEFQALEDLCPLWGVPSEANNPQEDGCCARWEIRTLTCISVCIIYILDYTLFFRVSGIDVGIQW